MSYVLINKMTAKNGKRNEVLSIMLESGKAFDNNPNCLLYLVGADKKDENVLWVQDIWTDADSHKLAMSDKTMQEFVQKAIPLLDGMPIQVEVDPKGGKQVFDI